MKYSKLMFQIDQLRKDKMIYGVESISVFVLALFMSAFLPSLLFQYFYADQQLLEEPLIFQYLPVASFALGVGYFLYATFQIVTKARKIKKLEKELSSKGDCCCGECDDNELQEMQDIVDELLQDTDKPAKRKTTVKSKKTGRKKTTKK